MKIIRYLIIIICFVIIFTQTIYAVDDQAVLQVKIREAMHYEQQGNFIKAEMLYKQLLENFAHNRQVVSRLIYLYMRTNKLDSLEKFLENEKDFLANNYYEITRIELLIKKNQLDEARNMVEVMLKNAKTNLSTIRQIAQVYQRYNLYDDAIELYLRARKGSKDSIVFAQELANIYQLQERYYDAMNEYLDILNNKTYKNVRYRIEKLNLSYEEIIVALETRQKQEPSIELQELIGEFLVLSRQYQRAFVLYKTLGNDALIKLSTLAEKQELFELSIQCFSEVLKSTEDEQTVLFLENKIGELYYSLNDHEKAYKHYKKVIGLYQKTKVSLPSSYIFGAYKNLAYIELFEYQNPVQSQIYLEKALDFTSVSTDKAELNILLSQCYLQQEDYLKSENMLTEIIENKHYNKDVKERAKVKRIETVLLKGDFSTADSISKSFFTHDYESKFVNDIAGMYRTVNNEMHLMQANDNVKNAALSLLRNMYFNNNALLNKDIEQLSNALQDSSAISYLKMQVADYYYDQGEYAVAVEFCRELLTDNDDPYREYVCFMIANCFNQLGLNEQALAYYTDYLLEFPQGTFAPDIRLRLKKFGTSDISGHR
ncbi:MAG: hypothetical protein H8E22_05550 [Candidatus Cloacimonetes bacterium]|nr:hypothetical protein [Candidatus Cloacimonadota bacterium]